MASELDSKYRSYRLDGIPAGVFGETYAVAVAIHTSGPHYKGEYYVLTQRPQPRLRHESWRWSSTGAPPELVTVDLDFIVETSRQYAQSALVDLLYERADETTNTNLLGLPMDLTESPASPFVSCWLRGVFHDQINEIGGITECEPLQTHLSIVRTMRVISRK